MGLVYLAGAIDLVNSNERLDWRTKMALALNRIGYSSFNPASAFSACLDNHEASRKLIDINEHAMLTSDLAIIVMSSNKASIGTPIELFMCRQANAKHVVVWNPSDDLHEFDDVNFDRYKRSHINKTLPAYIGGLTRNVVSSFDDALAYAIWLKHGNEPTGFFDLPMKTRDNTAMSQPMPSYTSMSVGMPSPLLSGD